MILFKASGATYQRVIAQRRHAFPFAPKDVRPNEFVLLSKNRADCRGTECQIQYAAKLLSVEDAPPEELERLFPGVRASQRWGCVATLFWARKLERAFNLTHALGSRAHHWDTVQEFARIDGNGEQVLFEFLCRTNPHTILDFVCNAQPDEQRCDTSSCRRS